MTRMMALDLLDVVADVVLRTDAARRRTRYRMFRLCGYGRVGALLEVLR